VVKGCPFYAVAFDESLNKVDQKGQMDIIVRFWNDGNQEVATLFNIYIPWPCNKR